MYCDVVFIMCDPLVLQFCAMCGVLYIALMCFIMCGNFCLVRGGFIYCLVVLYIVWSFYRLCIRFVYRVVVVLSFVVVLHCMWQFYLYLVWRFHIVRSGFMQRVMFFIICGSCCYVVWYSCNGSRSDNMSQITNRLLTYYNKNFLS